MPWVDDVAVTISRDGPLSIVVAGSRGSESELHHRVTGIPSVDLTFSKPRSGSRRVKKLNRPPGHHAAS